MTTKQQKEKEEEAPQSKSGDPTAEDAAAPAEAAPAETAPPPGTADLEVKLQEAQAAAETHRNLLLRKAAEFENYRKRAEADALNLVRNANESLIASLLPILNDFVRSLKAGSEQRDYDAFYRGVELIYNKFSKVLEAQGLAPFDSVGKPFDVDYHDALLQVPSGEHPPHTVIQEVERGYKLHDKVLRHAKVIVSTHREEDEKRPEDVPGNGDREGRKKT